MSRLGGSGVGCEGARAMGHGPDPICSCCGCSSRASVGYVRVDATCAPRGGVATDVPVAVLGRRCGLR